MWQTELHCSFPSDIAKYRKRFVAKNVAHLDGPYLTFKLDTSSDSSCCNVFIPRQIAIYIYIYIYMPFGRCYYLVQKLFLELKLYWKLSRFISRRINHNIHSPNTVSVRQRILSKHSPKRFWKFCIIRCKLQSDPIPPYNGIFTPMTDRNITHIIIEIIFDCPFYT